MVWLDIVGAVSGYSCSADLPFDLHRCDRAKWGNERYRLLGLAGRHFLSGELCPGLWVSRGTSNQVAKSGVPGDAMGKAAGPATLLCKRDNYPGVVQRFTDPDIFWSGRPPKQ